MMAFTVAASAALASFLCSRPPLPLSRHARISKSIICSEGTDIRLVSLVCPPEVSAAELTDSLMEVGALYVSVSDGAAGTVHEDPIYHAHTDTGAGMHTFDASNSEPNPESWDDLMTAPRRLWSNCSLEVGFKPDFDVERAMLSVLTDAGQSASTQYSVEDIAPKDWVVEVQANWPPVVLPACLTIAFPWHTEADLPKSAPPVVTLHPGMAFGTGEHQTTQLCCLALRRLLSADEPVAVLDYGSGSGILSFAALLFGAERAVGVEIDTEALAISRLNAAENGFEDAFVAELPEAEAARGGTYPIVVANILAGTLVELCGVISARVAPGGVLLMSGIWGEEQAERVQAAYAAKGFGDFTLQFAEGGWALLVGSASVDGSATLASATATEQAHHASLSSATELEVLPPPGFVWGGEF